MSLIEDRKHKVVEHTILDLWQLSVDEGLLQEEAHQVGLVVRVPQGSQALQDAGDAQAVVSVTVNDKKLLYILFVLLLVYNCRDKA